ncbi:MAG: dTDP-4-dehydrorhamnose 3,5-epimerase [Terracidiphilus sp.]
MKFNQTALKGAYVIELEKLADDRGYFARAWCQHEFLDHGLDVVLVQCSISYNAKAGTLRGMHYQDPPYAETKLVRCTCGAVYDVIVDLRPDSPTFLQWTGVELTPENGRMMYVPKGFAHGFQSLAPESMLFYQISEFYAREYSRGVRWNDPLLKIEWPLEVGAISPRDQEWQDINVARFEPLRQLPAALEG